MSISEQAGNLLTSHYGEGPGAAEVVSVPGRINLIGEHVDYHDLPVLPMAIQRHVSVAFRLRRDRCVRAVSGAQPGQREFNLGAALQPRGAGDWINYLQAASVAVQERWPLTLGIDAAIESDLPIAAGLSSSTALLTGFAIALLSANGIYPTVRELMDVLPEGEHFVGTRGGGMDHAAVLAAQSGCALLVQFAPLELRSVAVPRDWSFLVAHSMSTAEKSGALRAKYNALREHGARALQAAGLPSYRDALDRAGGLPQAGDISERERQVFRHVIEESLRVREAVQAFENSDFERFGRLLSASHASLRDNLLVSTPAIDALVAAAMGGGAVGARLTGAGFGGCVIALCKAATREEVRERLMRDYYSKKPDFDPKQHLFFAEPSHGALA